MNFEPSVAELAASEDLFNTLLHQGRKIMKQEDRAPDHIREMQEAQFLRNSAQSQRILERMAWRPRKSIALVHTYVCLTCHTGLRVFSGFGVSMYRNLDGAERIVMTACLDEAYPREVHELHTITPICANCLPSRGFPNA